MATSIPLSMPWLSSNEKSRVAEAIDSGWLTQNGPEVALMESNLHKFIVESDAERNTEYEVTTTSNGTNALHLALLALNISPGDEVIVPNFAYIAVINAVVYCGATPVVADVSSDNWNIDPVDLQRCISANTKALIVVDNYGKLNNFRELREIVNNRFPIIQDAAESFPDSCLPGNSLGDLLTFSFYGNKVFTSAEGGAIAASTNLIQEVKSLKNQALESKGEFTHVNVGYNYRITNVHAAIFNAQWDRRIEILNERRRVMDAYSMHLSNKWADFDSNFNSNPWLATVLLPNYVNDTSEIRSRLRQNGIETRPGFALFTKQPFLSRYLNPRETPVASSLSQRIISLPTYPQLSNSEIEFVCEKLLQILHV